MKLQAIDQEVMLLEAELINGYLLCCFFGGAIFSKIIIFDGAAELQVELFENWLLLI